MDINEKPAGVGNEPSKTDFSIGHEQVMIVSISSETNICYKSYLLRTIISRKNIRQMEYEEDNMDTLRTIKIRFEIGLELVLS